MPAPKPRRAPRRKRTSDPNLEPGLAAATRRSRAPVKKAPAKRKPFMTATVPAKRGSATAELKSLQNQMKNIMNAMRPFAATPKKKTPAGTSDPNLEPGVASATRRAQKTPAVKPLSSKAALAKRSAAAKRKRTADAAKTVAKRPYSRRSGMTPETDAAIQRRPVTKKSTPTRLVAPLRKRLK